MQKIQSLILLVKSLSKSEKKAIQLNSQLLKGDKQYIELYDLIEKNNIYQAEELKIEFSKKSPKNAFHPTANYLYDYILDLLIKIKTKKNDEYSLYIDFLKAKVLDERKLDAEYYQKLDVLESKCRKLNNFTLLLEIQQLKLEYIRENELIQTSEDDMFKKIYDTNDTLKILRQINEQSTLYEMLMERVINAKNAKNASKDLLNDLVISEISLNANLKNNIFEIDKIHLLFQAQYLIFVNDYNSALNTFIELEVLFNKNKPLWSNRPYIYLRILEGILASLRGIKQYEQMEYFLQKIEDVESDSQAFDAEKQAVVFIYRAIVSIENKNNEGALDLYKQHSEDSISKTNLLNPHRYLYLQLYLAIIFLQNNDPEKARRQITKIINSKSYDGFLLFRVIQLLNLIIHYELKSTNLITSRIRSIKRTNRLNNRNSKLEETLFFFLELSLETLSNKRKLSLIMRIEETFEQIKQSPIDSSMMRFYDFKDWMLSKLIK